MVESCGRVARFIGNSEFSDFQKNEMMYDAVLMQIVNIGEIINRLSDEFKEKYDYLPWYQVIGMRNRVSHGYFEIEEDTVWKTVKIDLPKLKKQIEKILRNYQK
ncbi:hypothetical protein A3F08_03135 [Candidatus Berkelbacteria bacterium RIFCSPHIGHO2_12_FULL_36_9]|uniref:DUF86 domain-containing protein n=1 Tax=Candidatus Berkelbacteria bacterium RIFCSPHIGHO2_12_FULL_36_9 TaxID=1797469 RepID=A0A1F5EFK2_9BACT|nr:MAG: hypothetical protein A3F08_03135 [Candidatus Berkelbacteria bacterium RIFCSPHIGHO2_12_FULL_36_9]